MELPYSGLNKDFGLGFEYIKVNVQNLITLFYKM
jgi:hypothetical protein